MTTTTQGPETGQAHVIARLAEAVGDALDRVTDAPVWSMTSDEQRAVLVGLTRVQARIAELRLRVSLRQEAPYYTLLGHGFMELIEHLPTDSSPNCGGLAATIVVTIDLDALVSGLGAASPDTGGRISAGEARRLACSAGIIPVILNGASMPLDVGREQRFHTKYQRIALAQRDKACTAENCDRPPSWCEAHHEVPWADGGETNIEKGRLLCAWHHHAAHDPGFNMRHLTNGQVRFRRRQ